MLAFFDADVPWAVHDHTTHEALLESAVDQRSFQRRAAGTPACNSPVNHI
jgi:hypothetical protein